MELNLTTSSSKKPENFDDFSGFCVFWSLSVPEQRYTYISPEIETVTGLKTTDLYLNPKLWLNLIQTLDIKTSRKIDGEQIYFVTNYSIKNLKGDIYKVTERIYPILDETEQLVYLQGVSHFQFYDTQNIIEVDDSPLPYFVLEKENSSWKIRKISNQLIDIFCEGRKETAKSEILLKTFYECVKNKIDEVLTSRTTKFEFETTWQESDRIFQIELVYQKNNKNEQIFGWASDITEIKLNEKRLQKLNSDKNKLLSIVSHDLKSPFNTILNFINLINDGIEIDEEQKKEYLRYIYDTAKQQLELIHDLLDWSKVEAGLLEFSPKFLNFNSILSKVISGFSGQVYQKGIQIVQEFEKDLKVFFDRNYLKIVLSNILSNAIKFSHRNGKIVISAEEDKDFTTIIIQDFGIGFSERYFRQITQSQNFELQVGTMGEKGTGFGLRFCYDIITTNYGKLYIESKSQKGTKVKIKLRKPKVVAVYFGEEEEIKRLRNYSSKIQPEGYLYLCRDIFDLLRFVEETNIDVAFINLDVIKSFQKSFLERIFEEFTNECKIIGFSENPENLKDLIEAFKISSVLDFSRLEKIIYNELNVLIEK